MSIRSRFRILITLPYSVSENPEDKNSAEELLRHISRICLKPGLTVDSGAFPENSSTGVFPLLEDLLAGYIKDEIRTELEAEFSGELNGTVSSIREAENLSEAQALRDAHIESIYRQVNPGGARIVLSLWNAAT